MNQFEREIRAFISENFLLAQPTEELPGDTSLTRGGVADSVGIVELMHFLETRYGIEISDEEAVPENIDTVDNIVRFVATKLSATRTASPVANAPGVAPA